MPIDGRTKIRRQSLLGSQGRMTARRNITHVNLFERDDMVSRRFQVPLFPVHLNPVFIAMGLRIRRDKDAAGSPGAARVVYALRGEVIVEHFADGRSGNERVDEGDVVEARQHHAEDLAPIGWRTISAFSSQVRRRYVSLTCRGRFGVGMNVQEEDAYSQVSKQSASRSEIEAG